MNKSAYAAALLYAFIIGFSFFFVKLALTAANPVDILAHRFTVAFLAALFPLLLGWVKIGISMKDALKVLPLALFYPVMFFAFQVFGLVYTSSSEAGIIQAAIPIFTMIFAAYFLNERFTKRQFFFTVLSAGGGGLHLYDEKRRHRKLRFERGGADFAFGAFIGGLQCAR